MTKARILLPDLSERLRAARSKVKLTQEAAAASLGMARTTLVAIEKGQRPVRPEELMGMASLYGVSVGKLTSPDAVHVDLTAKFRRAEGREASRAATEALAWLNRFATGAVQLERVLDQPLRTDYPPPIRINPRDVDRQADDAANGLRARLGVGLAPIPDLIGVLEVELGLRLFFRPLPSQIAGLYAYDPVIGACILINANHQWKRRIQTAAHDTGHFASDRSHVEVIEEIRRTGELRGRPRRHIYASDIPAVKAYVGRLPVGYRGFEFETDTPPDDGCPPHECSWRGPRLGVRVEGDWAIIQIRVTNVQ